MRHARTVLTLCMGTILAAHVEARAQFATPTAPSAIPSATPSAAPSATPLPLSARAHRDELQAAESALRAMESDPQRSFKPLRGLENPRVVRREDGAKLEVGGGEWAQRRVKADLDQGGTSVSRSEIREARQAVEVRRHAVDDWAFPASGKYLPPDSQARAAILDWEKRGVIQTGPPGWQKRWLDFVRWCYDGLARIGAWLDSLFKRSPSAQPRGFDPKTLELLFTITLAGVLAGAVYLTWRALGGHFQRGPRGARDVLLEGEDQALLRLPPDELLSRAHAFAAEGNFREAIRHRYLSLLLLLDARGAWRYDRRRTNWEHIARLKAANAPRQGVDVLSDLTLRFDRVRYGNEAADAPAWTRFDHDAQAALELLRQAGAPASGAGASGARR